MTSTMFGGREKKGNGAEDISPMVWKENAEMSANPLSGLFFLWLQPLFTRASKLRRVGRWLEMEDLAPIPDNDTSEQVDARFQAAYASFKPKPKAKKAGEEDTEDDEGPSGETAKQLEKRLTYALFATCKRRIIEGGAFRLVNSILQFTFPVLLNLVLAYYQDVQSGRITESDPPLLYYKGYWLSALLMFFVASKALTEGAYFHRMNRCSWQVKTAISSSIYSKSLRLAASEQQKTSLGEIVNLMQVDASKVEMFMMQLHTLWDGLFQIAGYMIILGTLLGWTCLIGMFIIVCSIPVMGKISIKMFGYNRSMVKHTDNRVKTVNEALQGILCVKMYSWEDPLAKQVDVSRQEELKSLRKIAYLRAFMRAFMTALPTIAAAATFLVYVYGSAGEISASILFSSIVAFDLIRMPLMMYPMALAQFSQCKVSLTRIAVFLGYDEVNEIGYTRDESADGEIIIEGATLYWSDPTKPLPRSALEKTSKLDDSQQSSRKLSLPGRLSRSSSKTSLSDLEEAAEEQSEILYPKAVLSDVNLHVGTGELFGIVGPVGSGKSTLISSILNESVLGEGSSITLNGKVAYVAQSAWILNKTVRENILFGLPFDQERYDKVVDACSLRKDLELLEHGDMTEIGERGINLSGGQKQRVSTARAAYCDADVYIFDDPLSALDPEVAESVFEECILKLLEGKTRLLVTNQLNCLPRCDSIVALGKHGKVLEVGKYENLIADKRSEVSRLLRGVTPSSRRIVKDKKSESGDNNNDKAGKELMTKEERNTGSVKLGVYKNYMRAGGGLLSAFLVFVAYLMSTGANVTSTVWISMWTADNQYTTHTLAFYIFGYALISILMGLMSWIRSYGLASFGVRSSYHLHGDVLRSIFRAPMSFFDTTPTGRILSRFSKDLYSIDNELSDFIDIFVFILLQLIVVMITIVVITPYFALVLPFLSTMYIFAMMYFRRVSRETKRLENITRSPIYSQFSETLGGLDTIRAFGKSSQFSDNFDSMLDANTRTMYCNKTADRWLSTRLESIAAGIVGCAALFSTQVVVSQGVSVGGDSSSFASLAGISLSYAITATGMMQYVVRSFAQVEAAMNSVERVVHYSENIPREAARTSLELEAAQNSVVESSASKAVKASNGEVIHTEESWPEHGAINLTNLQMRYRNDTPLVLRGLNVDIKAGQRIGVVGRTGSGKSSMLLVLMRIVEPYLSPGVLEKYRPPLSIDGLDALRIGLLDLRSRIGIVPQLPVLFSGTVRSNLDPFDQYCDDQIWSVLDACRMKEAVEKMTDGLNSLVAEYGTNFSQGQRQLLCLGRALLKQCKILLLDEATSSVDFETDEAIQTTIRQCFKKCTIITIAHRVNTIMDSDKILVMDDGLAAEFDSPQQLLKREDSLFTEIVRHSQGHVDE